MQASLYVLEEKQLHKAYERKCVWEAVDKLNNHYKRDHDHKVILKLS